MITFTKSTKVKKWFKIIRKKYVLNPVLEIPWAPYRYDRNLDQIEEFPWNLKNDGVATDLRINQFRKAQPLHRIFKIAQKSKLQMYLEEMYKNYPNITRSHVNAALLLSNNNVEDAKVILELQIKLKYEHKENDNVEVEEEISEPLNLSIDCPTSTQKEEPTISSPKINILSNIAVPSKNLPSIESLKKTPTHDTKESSLVSIPIANSTGKMKTVSKTSGDLSNELLTQQLYSAKGIQESISPDVSLITDLNKVESDQKPVHVMQASTISNTTAHNPSTLENTSETEISAAAVNTNSQDNFLTTNKLRNYRKEIKTLSDTIEASSNKEEVLKPQDSVKDSQIQTNKDHIAISKNKTVAHRPKKIKPKQKKVVIPDISASDINKEHINLDHINTKAISYDELISCISPEILLELHNKGVDIRQIILYTIANCTNPYINENDLNFNIRDTERKEIGENKIENRTNSNFNNTLLTASRQIPNDHYPKNNVEIPNIANTVANVNASNFLVHEDMKTMENTKNAHLGGSAKVSNNNTFSDMEYWSAVQKAYENHKKLTQFVTNIPEQVLHANYLTQSHNRNMLINAGQVRATHKSNNTNKSLPEKATPSFERNQIIPTHNYVDDRFKNVAYMPTNPSYMPRYTQYLPKNLGVRNYDQGSGLLIPRYFDVPSGSNIPPITNPPLNEPQANILNNAQIVPELPGIQAIPNIEAAAFGHISAPYTKYATDSRPLGSKRDLNKVPRNQPQLVNLPETSSTTQLNEIFGNKQLVDSSAVPYPLVHSSSTVHAPYEEGQYNNVNPQIKYIHEVVPEKLNALPHIAAHPDLANYVGYQNNQNNYLPKNLKGAQVQYGPLLEANKFLINPITTPQISQARNTIYSALPKYKMPVLPTYDMAVKNRSLSQNINLPNDTAQPNRTANYQTATFSENKLAEKAPNSPFRNSVIRGSSTKQPNLMPEHRNDINLITELSLNLDNKENRIAHCTYFGETKTLSVCGDNSETTKASLVGDYSQAINNNDHGLSSGLLPITTNEEENKPLSNKPTVLDLKQNYVSSNVVEAYKSSHEISNELSSPIKRTNELHHEKAYLSKTVNSSTSNLAQHSLSPHNNLPNNEVTTIVASNSMDPNNKYFQTSLNDNQETNITYSSANELPYPMSLKPTLSLNTDNDEKNTLAPCNRRAIRDVSVISFNPKQIEALSVGDNEEETNSMANINDNFQSCELLANAHEPCQQRPYITKPIDLSLIKLAQHGHSFHQNLSENEIAHGGTIVAHSIYQNNKSSHDNQRLISNIHSDIRNSINLTTAVSVDADKRNKLASYSSIEETTTLSSRRDNLKKANDVPVNDSDKENNSLAEADSNGHSLRLLPSTNFEEIKLLPNHHTASGPKHNYVPFKAADSHESPHDNSDGISKKSSTNIPNKLLLQRACTSQTVNSSLQGLAQYEYSSHQTLPAISNLLSQNNVSPSETLQDNQKYIPNSRAENYVYIFPFQQVDNASHNNVSNNNKDDEEKRLRQWLNQLWKVFITLLTEGDIQKWIEINQNGYANAMLQIERLQNILQKTVDEQIIPNDSRQEITISNENNSSSSSLQSTHIMEDQNNNRIDTIQSIDNTQNKIILPKDSIKEVRYNSNHSTANLTNNVSAASTSQQNLLNNPDFLESSGNETSSTLVSMDSSLHDLASDCVSSSGESSQSRESNKRRRASLQSTDSSDDSDDNDMPPSKHIKMLITRENNEYVVKQV